MASIEESQKVEVKRMYQQKEMSMQEIADELGVSLSSVVYFMRKHSIPRRSVQEANAVAYSKQDPSFRKETNLSKKEKELKSIGAMLYWCEGYSTQKSHMVDFANSDSDMIQLFLHFLRTCYQINEDKLRVYLYCYNNQNTEKLISFWSKVTDIPKEQFQKPYVRDDFSEEARQMKYGMVHIRYYDKKLLNELLSLIELKKESFGVGSEAAKRTGL